MFHSYRSGKYPISSKAWRKLEAAERAAGIHQGTTADDAAFAGNEANPKDFSPTPGEKIAPAQTLLETATLHEQVFRMREQLDKIQASYQSGPFTLAELETRMRNADAWPASPEDGKLTPAQLWQKYAPPAGTPSPPPILAPGVRKRDLEDY